MCKTIETINVSDEATFFMKERQYMELARVNPKQSEKYVLWLICDMYIGFSSVREGKVYIYTEDGQIIVEQATRKPYPNKCISHVSRCCGRKRIYGVPLLFDSLDDIKKIKNIIVTWDVYCISYNKDQNPVLEWNKNIEAYNVHFDIDPDESKRIFTLVSKSYYMGDSKNIEGYLSEFQSYQTASQIPGKKSTYFLAPEHEQKAESFESACKMLIIPGATKDFKIQLNAITASLAYGVGWKEKDVYKAVYVLAADITLTNSEVAPFAIF